MECLTEPPEGESSVRVVTREEWGGREPAEVENPPRKLDSPLTHVTFIHTHTESCHSVEECRKIIKGMQDRQMDHAGLPDITYNFLIGGDGLVYEARGWTVEPLRPLLYDYLGTRGVEIAYIGDYESDLCSFLIGGNGWIYEGRGWNTEPLRYGLYEYLTGKGIEVAYIGVFDGISGAMVGLIRNAPDETNPKKDPKKEDPYMHIISRKEWGAHPPQKELPSLSNMLGNVRFTHTQTDSCATHDECKKVLRNLQFVQMDTFGLPDITYNFMIGAEGYVYEGRGWFTEPSRPAAHGELAMDALEIAYIGDYEDTTPPAPLIRAAMELVVYAVRKKILSHYFKGIHLT